MRRQPKPITQLDGWGRDFLVSDVALADAEHELFLILKHGGGGLGSDVRLMSKNSLEVIYTHLTGKLAP